VASPGWRLLGHGGIVCVARRSQRRTVSAARLQRRDVFYFCQAVSVPKGIYPEAFSNIEKVATGSKTARKRLERVLKNIESRSKALAKSAKKG
jgi:hypothetical protein